MTSLEMHPTFSAAAPMLSRQVREPALIGCMLAGLGTSTAYVSSQDFVWQSQRCLVQTTAGAVVLSMKPAGAAIGELRRLSGLTWDQLARVFSVSRRSLHFWASGKPMASSNEEHLQRVLAVVRKIDRGAASENRSVLLGVRDDGSIPFDLLVAGDYERVVVLLGPGEARRISTPKLSEEARAARAPRPPEELVEALQDRVQPTSGRLLAAKPIATRIGVTDMHRRWWRRLEGAMGEDLWCRDCTELADGDGCCPTCHADLRLEECPECHGVGGHRGWCDEAEEADE